MKLRRALPAVLLIAWTLWHTTRVGQEPAETEAVFVTESRKVCEQAARTGYQDARTSGLQRGLTLELDYPESGTLGFRRSDGEFVVIQYRCEH